MPFPVRPEWSTASVGSSHAPTDAVDHSAPSAIRPESTYISGKVVQTNGATSVLPAVILPSRATALEAELKEALTGRLDVAAPEGQAAPASPGVVEPVGGLSVAP